MAHQIPTELHVPVRRFQYVLESRGSPRRCIDGKTAGQPCFTRKLTKYFMNTSPVMPDPQNFVTLCSCRRNHSTQIEVALAAKTESYVAVGWRPSDIRYQPLSNSQPSSETPFGALPIPPPSAPPTPSASHTLFPSLQTRAAAPSAGKFSCRGTTVNTHSTSSSPAIVHIVCSSSSRSPSSFSKRFPCGTHSIHRPC